MSTKKISVGILGATGSVGQRFIELLTNHPWFEITALAASERSAGKSYREGTNWLMSTPLSPTIGNMKILPCQPNLPCEWVFSALDSSVAGEIETAFAEAGYIVHSNARNHRMNSDVPLLIPEVNSDHLQLLDSQRYAKGRIITNPNCSTIGLVLALKPLQDAFGIEAVNVVTMQAVSGAGYPGVASLDIMDNVIPLIKGEEDKLESEPLKIMGTYNNGKITHSTFKISAHCNRVAVNDGHTECISVKLKQKAPRTALIDAWRNFSSIAQKLNLPTAPLHPIHYFDEEAYPQPKLHRNLDKGMAVSIGRLRECPLFDFKFTILSHNTIRGAAGGALLNAEIYKALSKK
ncbi:MAG: aspartate-semialdehyde dehydrogenase [Parachlamydiaceae bacterium]|nr:aspartate-semialdehyde dehydrogenase [Parachlamydiaceae bacterium]